MDGASVVPHSDHSVSAPFHAVAIVTLGLALVHSQRFACFLCVCAFVVHLLSTGQQAAVCVESVWNHLPFFAIMQSGVGKYLALGLGRWIASTLYSGYVSRAIHRTAPLTRLGNARTVAVTLLVGALLWAVRLCDPEGSSLLSITDDRSVWLYFHTSLVAESVRAATQVFFVVSQVPAREQRGHMILYSSLVIAQNLQSTCSSGFTNRVTDTLLQVFLILYLWLCPRHARQVQRREPVEDLCPKTPPHPLENHTEQKGLEQAQGQAEEREERDFLPQAECVPGLSYPLPRPSPDSAKEECVLGLIHQASAFSPPAKQVRVPGIIYPLLISTVWPDIRHNIEPVQAQELSSSELPETTYPDTNVPLPAYSIVPHLDYTSQPKLAGPKDFEHFLLRDAALFTLNPTADVCGPYEHLCCLETRPISEDAGSGFR
jgi:hypothetical protein